MFLPTISTTEMKIKKISPSSRKKDRFLIQFENGSQLKATEQEILAFSLYEGKELSEEEYGTMEQAAGLSCTKGRAANIIGARALSKKELEKRLLQKGESPENAAAAVAWLEEIGAIDDRSYADSVVRHYTAAGYGPAKLREELYRRGVPRELWEEALEELPDPSDAIDRYIASRLRGGKPDDKQKHRICDGLRRRGFRWEDIKTAMYRLEASLEED